MNMRFSKRVICPIIIMMFALCFAMTIKFAKAEGNVVINYTFSNNMVGNAAGTIQLSVSNSSYDGDYDVHWADSTGILTEYDKITTLAVSGNKSEKYEFVSLNAIPDGALRVVAVKDGNIKASYSIPSEKILKENKSFSFGALSDIHLDGAGSDESSSMSDIDKEISYFKSKNVAAICNSGDITRDGKKKDIDAVVSKISNIGIPVYTARGNHDCQNDAANMSQWGRIEPNGIMFEKIINNEVFVFMGMNKVDYTNPFTDEQISKLSKILEQYKNRRVFLFEHVFYGDVGNVNNLYPYSSLSNNGTAGQFKNLMKENKNVISFTGHSHLHYELQRISQFANVSEQDGSYGYRVHVPSASRPRKNDADTEDKSSNTYTYDEGALGYLVDVYKDCIVLKGRDFSKGKNLPYATYIMYTANGEITPIVNDNNSNQNDTYDELIQNNDDNSNQNDTYDELNQNNDNNYNQNSTYNEVVTEESQVRNSNTEEIVGNISINNSSTDVVVVIDVSMSYEDRFEKAKNETKTYINNVLSCNSNNRISIVKFGLEAETLIGFTKDKSDLDNSVEKIKLQKGISGSNMHHGVCKAIEQLKTSGAGKKELVIISDGRTNRIVGDLETHDRVRSRNAVKKEISNAKNIIENLSVSTILYCNEDDIEAKQFLKEISDK